MTSSFAGHRIPQWAGLDLPRPRALLEGLDDNGAVAGAWLEFARAVLMDGLLPENLRELAILRVGYLRKSPHILDPHRLIGRHVGLDDCDIAAACDGAADHLPWSDKRTLLEAVDDLVEAGRLSCGLRKRLRRHLDTAQINELCMVVGQYQIVAMLCHVLHIDP